MALVNPPPNRAPMVSDALTALSEWAEFFMALFRIAFALTQSGTTAQRPTGGLWIGRMYYDTTLAKPIWVNAVTPSVVWKDAAGTTV